MVHPLIHLLVWSLTILIIPVMVILTTAAGPTRDFVATTLQMVWIPAVVSLVGVAILRIIVLLSCFGLDNLDYSKLIDLKRDRLGNLPYGEPIYECRTRGQVALTFDDGPYKYTEDLLNILKAAKVNATFFITGSNLEKGAIDNPDLPWASLIRRMDREGHQIATHNWANPNIDIFPDSLRRQEIHRLEYAFSKILGKIPTYIRPPTYTRPPDSSCGNSCLATLKELGYHVVYFDLDTEDYTHNLVGQIEGSIQIALERIYGTNPKKSSILSIAHDIYQRSVTMLTIEMLKAIKAKGFEGVTVGKCLGDSPSNWYRNVVV
ncbi:hypothetical protein TWF730_008363 [Orbilia blumenaviensis]|uniref:NodB homology domain-containing protein n=1 Tax=Orbilia blumenaviensis TaxID=1796055 RepID=A0AAV9V2F2_9PEZI